MKDDIKTIENFRCLDFAKLTKEINFFHEITPGEVMQTVFQTLVSAEQRLLVDIAAFFYPFALFMIAANGGIDPYNPDHLNTVKRAIMSFDTPMTKNFFSLSCSLDLLYTNFFREKLG